MFICRRDWLAQFRPAFVLMIYMTVMYAITYAGLRYSLPLHPILIALVVVAYEALTRPVPLIAPSRAPAEPPAPAPSTEPADPGFDPILSAMVGRRRS
jgi:hypothetical protein